MKAGFSPWKKITLILVSFAFCIQVKAQSDSLKTIQQDSILSIQQAQSSLLVSQADSIRKADSIEQAGIASKLYSKIHSNIQDAFNEAGVEILSPHYRAPRDGNHITIPPDYLPPDYEAPSFQVNIRKEKGE